MAGGALYEAFLVVQFFAITAFLASVGAWKLLSHSKEQAKSRDLVLWFGFGFACVAATFDGLTLLAGRSGSLVLVNHRRDAVLVFAILAATLAVFGRGRARAAIIAMSVLLLLISRPLVLSFLLQR